MRKSFTSKKISSKKIEKKRKKHAGAQEAALPVIAASPPPPPRRQGRARGRSSLQGARHGRSSPAAAAATAPRMQEEGEGPPRAVDLRGKEEGELWTAYGRKEGCGIQKVGVGGGSHHVGAVGKNRPLETEVMVDRRFSFAKGKTAGDVNTENRKRDLVLVGNRL